MSLRALGPVGVVESDWYLLDFLRHMSSSTSFMHRKGQAFLLHLPLHVYRLPVQLGSSQVMDLPEKEIIRQTTLTLPSEAFNKTTSTPHTKAFSEGTWVSSLPGSCRVWRIPQAVLFSHSHIDKFPHQPRQHWWDKFFCGALLFPAIPAVVLMEENNKKKQTLQMCRLVGIVCGWFANVKVARYF